MADPSTPLSDREVLAAEFALGLLDGPERAEALRLCLSDQMFAAEVEAWRLRLSPLLQAVPSVDPPEQVWATIEARIGSGRAAPTIRSLRFWRGAALVSGALAASLALFIIMRPADLKNPASMAVSQLANAEGAAAMAISYDPQQGLLRLSAASLATGAKRPELWVIPQDGVPRSLGVIQADGGTLSVDKALRGFLQNGVTLAITLEDGATAPHKAPSSSPVLTGRMTII